MSHTFYTDAELAERGDSEFQKFYQNYRDVGQKLMPYFGNATIDQAHYYISQLAMYRYDESYSEKISGLWKPDQQTKLICDAIEALQNMNDNLHPEVASQLALNYRKMSSRMPFAKDLKVAFEQALPIIELGQVKRKSMNWRAVAIASICVEAWERLGQRTSRPTVNDGSPIVKFIQDMFDVLNEPNGVLRAYKNLKDIQKRTSR